MWNVKCSFVKTVTHKSTTGSASQSIIVSCMREEGKNMEEYPLLEDNSSAKSITNQLCWAANAGLSYVIIATKRIKKSAKKAVKPNHCDNLKRSTF